MKRLLLLTCLFSVVGFGQTMDAELWTELGLKADIGKKWSAKYETQTRFYKNVSTLKTYYNEFSVDYEFLKNLEIGAAYRYSRKNRETHYIGDHRLCVNLSYSKKILKSGLRFKTRARYQYDFDRLSVINETIYPDMVNRFRWKFDLSYKKKSFKRLAPFVGYEFFKEIQPVASNGLDAYRIYGGIDFDLPARHELGLKYIYELENGNTPQVSHIYLVQYNYELPSKLFKKKKKK